MIWTLLCKFWLYFTLALHPSDQHVLHYITRIKNIFGKLNSFLQTYVMSPVQQASLEHGKAYIQQIEILHYIDFVKKKDDLNLNTVV